jgi:hypothetical protein
MYPLSDRVDRSRVSSDSSSFTSAMFRRVALVAVAVALVACGNCDNKCTEGITFLVGDVAGALARGTSEPLEICFDDQCHDVTISRTNAGGSVFVAFSGVGKDIDHTLTVTGTGSLKGSYTGKLASFVQKPGGGCDSCALATVKIGTDGSLLPGVPAT